MAKQRKANVSRAGKARSVGAVAKLQTDAMLRTAGGRHQLRAGDVVHVIREEGGSGMVRVERSGMHGFLDRDNYELAGPGSGVLPMAASAARPTPPFNALTNPPVGHLHTSDGVIDLAPDTHIHVSAEENGHGLVSVLGRAEAGFMDTTEYRPDSE